MKYLLLISFFCYAVSGCDKEDLTITKFLRSQPQVKFIRLTTNRPLQNIQDTIALFNQVLEENFMYQRISYKLKFKDTLTSHSQYTVVPDSVTTQICFHVFKCSGITTNRNIPINHQPILIIDEPDSLFLKE